MYFVSPFRQGKRWDEMETIGEVDEGRGYISTAAVYDSYLGLA
jgi:hypothetical protein